MAISTALYMNEIDEFLRNVRQNPASVEQETRHLVKKITKTERSRRINVVATVLEKIYDYDHKALRRDLHKVMVFKAERVADEQERINFLMCIKGTIDFFMQGDYSELFKYLDSLCVDEDSCDYTDLPFN